MSHHVGGGRAGGGKKKKGARQTAEYPLCPLPTDLVVLKQAVSGSERRTVLRLFKDLYCSGEKRSAEHSCL